MSNLDGVLAPALSEPLTELVLRWQGRVLEVKRLLGPGAVVIGGGVDVDLFVPLEGGGNHELLSSSGQLQLPPGTDVTAGDDGGVTLGLGLHSIELRRAQKERSAVVDARFDAFWANVVVVVVLAGAAVLAALLLAPPDLARLDDELMQNPTRFQTLVLAPRPTNNAFLERMTAPSANSTVRTRATTTAATATAKSKTATTKPKHSDQQVVADRLTSLFGDGGKTGLAALFADDGDGDLNDALGGLRGGTAVASLGGDGALGLRGLDGPSTGTLSGGPIGTRRAGQNGESWGAGDGFLTDKEDRDINVSTGPIVDVFGSLDPELIRRVVREHADQVRYCYERELNRSPGLQGKVNIKWTIDAAGKVTRAAIAESSLANAAVEGCLTGRVLTWRFPAPRGGGTVVVNYPFVFKRSGG